MQSKLFTFPLLLVVGFILQGCATSRSEIKLESTPTAQATVPAPTKGKVVIRNIKDSRIFEQAPGDPSIPSLGFEGAAQATADIKARAIGRKRNTFGKALGDILLENGQTVENVIRENLATALRESGYQVVTNGAEANALVLDADIKQFWSWFQPGFWAITLHSKIETTLNTSNNTTPITISVHAEESGLAATDSAWLEITNKGLEAYREKIKSTNLTPK